MLVAEEIKISFAPRFTPILETAIPIEGVVCPPIATRSLTLVALVTKSIKKVAQYVQKVQHFYLHADAEHVGA